MVSEQQQTICCVEAEVQRFSRLNSGLSSEVSQSFCLSKCKKVLMLTDSIVVPGAFRQLQECKLFLSKCEDDVKALTSERQVMPSIDLGFPLPPPLS